MRYTLARKDPVLM